MMAHISWQEGEPSEIEQLEGKMSKLIKTNQHQMKTMNERMDRIETLLNQLCTSQGLAPRRSDRLPTVEIYAPQPRAVVPPTDDDEPQHSSIA